MMKPSERQILIHWIVLLDLAYELPEISRLIREIFLLEVKRDLTEEISKTFDVQFAKIREEAALDLEIPLSSNSVVIGS